MKHLFASLCLLALAFGSAQGQTFAVTDGTETIASITIDGERIAIAHGGEELVCDSGNAMKASYDTAGAPRVHVKRNSENIKIYDADGSFAWKIRLYDDKYKVADNEENADAWQVKHKGEKHKIYQPDDTQVADVRFKNGWNVVSGSGPGFKLESVRLRGSAGVLAMMHVPLEHRLVALAELLRLNR